jgi:hypothetical protein
MEKQVDMTDGHWHLDKRVNLSHLAATLALAVSVFVYVNKQDARVTIMEQQITHMKDLSARQEKLSVENQELLRQDVRSVRDEIRELRKELANGSGPRSTR